VVYEKQKIDISIPAARFRDIVVSVLNGKRGIVFF
jgi:hypothetical protein